MHPIQSDTTPDSTESEASTDWAAFMDESQRARSERKRRHARQTKLFSADNAATFAQVAAQEEMLQAGRLVWKMLQAAKDYPERRRLERQFRNLNAAAELISGHDLYHLAQESGRSFPE